MSLYLAIPTMSPERLKRTLEHAGKYSTWTYNVLIHANGIAPNLLDLPLKDIKDLRVSSSNENIGAVGGLQALYDLSLKTDCSILGMIHDDVDILESGWDHKVTKFFQDRPKCGLMGWFGATRLGDADLYKTPYRLQQLARGGGRSMMTEAEVHGMRSDEPCKVATIDGFSMFARREFLEQISGWSWWPKDLPFHSYDNALALMAKRMGWETWYQPMTCKHWGGQTSTSVDFVKQFGRSEGEIHSAGHEWLYEEFKDVLPLVVE